MNKQIYCFLHNANNTVTVITLEDVRRSSSFTELRCFHDVTWFTASQSAHYIWSLKAQCNLFLLLFFHPSGAVTFGDNHVVERRQLQFPSAVVVHEHHGLVGRGHAAGPGRLPFSHLVQPGLHLRVHASWFVVVGAAAIAVMHCVFGRGHHPVRPSDVLKGYGHRFPAAPSTLIALVLLVGASPPLWRFALLEACFQRNGGIWFEGVSATHDHPHIYHQLLALSSHPLLHLRADVDHICGIRDIGAE